VGAGAQIDQGNHETPEGYVKAEWMKSVKKELKTLIDSGTFAFDKMNPGKTSTPMMEIVKEKMKSDGSLDKLKTRMVVRGDLQNGTQAEDKLSPTVSFQSLKKFLAHTTRLKARVKKLDFIGAFLQANTGSRIFVTIPAIFGTLFP
jgi:predicted transcriptional regulator